MADSQNIHAIGRRKEAVCRVYLRPGSGKWDVNGRTLGDYFPRPSLVSAIQQPFTATDTLGRYDVRANVEGGGSTGQAGALRLAVARALVKIDEAYRRKLRDLGQVPCAIAENITLPIALVCVRSKRHIDDAVQEQ